MLRDPAKFEEIRNVRSKYRNHGREKIKTELLLQFVQHYEFYICTNDLFPFLLKMLNIQSWGVELCVDPCIANGVDT